MNFTTGVKPPGKLCATIFIFKRKAIQECLSKLFMFMNISLENFRIKHLDFFHAFPIHAPAFFYSSLFN